MCIKCGPECKARLDLDKAAAGLAEASRLLSGSTCSDSVEVIDTYYAFVRAAKARVSGALMAYREHLLDSPVMGVSSGRVDSTIYP
jgi:hypothetical protein